MKVSSEPNAWFCVAALSFAGLLAVTRPAAGQSDDFNDADDQLWTRVSPLAAFGVSAVFSFPSGGYRIRTTKGSPDPMTLGPGRAGSLRNDVTYTNFYIAVDLVGWDETQNQAFGIIARVNDPGLGTTDGYSFTYQNADHEVSISVLTNEVPTDLPGGIFPLALDPSKSYRLVFLGGGSVFEGRVYELPDLTTPLVTVTAQDGAYDHGVSGLVVVDNSKGTGLTDVTFDNYFASIDEPIRLTVARLASDEIELSWPSVPGEFQLQEAAFLSPLASWTDITSGIVENGGVKSYTYKPRLQSTFFRLKK